jgi:hypothetical protein
MMLALAPAAFDQVLDLLGHASKKALLFHLKQRYGISLNNWESFSLERLNVALQDLLGVTGAILILESVFVEMDRLASSR